MNIVVVGLGSMGRRRIRLLKQISKELIITGVDSKKDRRKQVEEEFDITTMDSLENALTAINPECVIVSTSPLSHATIIEKCLLHGCNVFTELNLVNTGYETNIKLAEDKNKVLFLSSTFLYREEISYINDKISSAAGTLNYAYHVGQYLPDWHPWENINEYFVGDKRTNGCRELFAIELPWLIKVFGDIKSFSVLSSKNSKLPINYNDNYMLVIEHGNGNKGMLAVDVISRKAVRNLEIFGEDLYLIWNGSPTGLKVFNYEDKVEEVINLYDNIDKKEGYASFIIENAYKNELISFLEEVKGIKSARYSFKKDIKVLEIIDQIEGENI
ncbi:MAG: Gfo/Idh/MocA family oxidoreductase [Lachnospiraceae bacterium]|nr:Gfo/Idh/MocA family oxidoreductase [Lachnospiraceae bacterium]